MIVTSRARIGPRGLHLACIAALIAGLLGVGALTAAEVGADDFRISNMGTADALADQDDFASALAYNSTTNQYLVVWAGDDTISGGNGDFEISGQLIDAATGAEVGADFQISSMGGTSASNDARTPAVAYNATSNQYLVVWSGDETNNQFEIYGRRVNATGAPSDALALRLSTMGADGDDDFDAETPSVACSSASAECLVAWSGNEVISGTVTIDPAFEIYGQRVSTSGAALTATGTDDFRISDMGTSDTNALFDAVAPSVTSNVSGTEYLVVWSGDDDTAPLVQDEFEIYGQRLQANGTETGANDFRISDMGSDGTATVDANEPAVTADGASGEYLVVWSGDDAPGEDEIYGQRLQADGTPTGANDFRLSDMGADGNNNLNAVTPAVSHNSDTDEYLVVWSGDDTLNGEFEIYGQRVSATGTQTGTNDFRISDMGPTGDITYTATLPAVAYSATSGEYLTVWTGDDNTGGLVNNQIEVFGQRLEFGPPKVTKVNSVADSGDGTLIEGETVAVPITQLLLTFNEPVSNTTTTSNYLLVNNGADNAFQTSICGTLQGDDTAIAINSAAFLSATNTVTLTVNGGVALPADGYRLFACADNLTDVENNPLDGNGDGTGGDDFIRNFSVGAIGVLADLRIAKAESQDPIVLGTGNLTYTLTVTNAGPAASAGVVLTDTLPNGVTVASVGAGIGVTCTQPAGQVRCVIGAMAASATSTVTIAVTPSAAGVLTNTAIVASPTTPDPIPANNSATITTTVSPASAQQANLSVTASTPAQVVVGATQTYQFTVSNSGPNTATAVQLSSTLPAGLALVSAASSVGSCTTNTGSGQVNCSLGNLASGASATVNITARATQVGAKSIVVTVSSATSDPTPSNNSATQSVTVGQAKLFLPIIFR
jgi:uncharacterized repeat protein (TIGR01451 family)